MGTLSLGGMGLVVVLVMGGAAQAAPGDLKLADVVAVAVRQSPELERARIDLDAARGALLQAEGSEDTHVGARLGGQTTHNPQSDPNGAFASNEIELALSLTKLLPTGGRLGLTASGDRQHFFGFAPLINGMRQQTDLPQRFSASLAVTLTQPLLRGAGQGGFEAPIRQAAAQRDAAALRSESRARDLVVSIAQAYWQVAFAWRQLEIRKASLDLAEQQLAYTQAAIRADKVARSEELAVQAAIVVRKQDALASEQDLYERSVALRRLAGLEIGPDAISVRTEALPAKLEIAQPDAHAVVRDAFAHSAELASLEAARRAAEAGLAGADNAARSRLDLDLSAGPIGADDRLPEAVSSAVNHPGYTVSGGLTFDHAIEQRTERGAQAVARAAVVSATVAERDARARLAVRATRAAQRAQAALLSIALGDQAISLAEQNVTAEEKRFQLGKSTNFDVLRRQDELQQALLRQASSMADYLAARADLDGLNGAILTRYGIVMP